MTTTKPLDTAAGFLEERADYLYVYVTKSTGDGWDVVLRIDGSYSDRAGAEAAAEGMRTWIRSLVDVSPRRRHWWAGPPWKRATA